MHTVDIVYIELFYFYEPILHRRDRWFAFIRSNVIMTCMDKISKKFDDKINY